MTFYKDAPGSDVNIVENFVFMFIDNDVGTWQNAYDECKNYKGFSLIMPKTNLQYNYAVEKQNEIGNKGIIEVYLWQFTLVQGVPTYLTHLH